MNKKENILLILWVIGSILSICIGWWIFYYHFIILIPPLALLASHGFYQLLDLFPYRKNRRYLIVRNLIILLLAIFFLAEFLRAYYYSYISTGIISGLTGREKLSAEEIYSRFRVQEYTITDFSMREDYRLSQYVKTHTKKEEKIFIWGWEALVYFLSERDPASCYIFIYPLIQDNLVMRKNAQKIFLEDMNKKKPRYFMVAKNDRNPIDQLGSERRLLFFPELAEILRSTYMKVNETERFIIYRRII
jgi:hypothetical protein